MLSQRLMEKLQRFFKTVFGKVVRYLRSGWPLFLESSWKNVYFQGLVKSLKVDLVLEILEFSARGP